MGCEHIPISDEDLNNKEILDVFECSPFKYHETISPSSESMQYATNNTANNTIKKIAKNTIKKNANNAKKERNRKNTGKKKLKLEKNPSNLITIQRNDTKSLEV